MKYTQVILTWITISLALGFVVKYIYGIKENEFFLFFLVIGLIIGFARALLIYFASTSKSDIFSEAKEIFNGKLNLNGETELIIKGKKIVLDYQLENSGRGAAEYVIANIDLSDIGKDQLRKCKDRFDIVEKNNRTYAVIYSSWGYKGEKFKNRIEKKLEIIDNCIE